MDKQLLVTLDVMIVENCLYNR